MATKDSRVDTYIAKSADFAKPILTHLRRLAHRACPQVEETLKWGMPHFVYKGALFGMAAFKQHVALTFWKGKLIFDSSRPGAMGQFGRITTQSDLPPDKVLLGYIKKAVQLNETGTKLPPRLKPKIKDLVIPPELASALKTNKKAAATFQAFSYSHRKDYAEWIAGAKRPETKQRRLETALEWLAQGKSKEWKYERC